MSLFVLTPVTRQRLHAAARAREGDLLRGLAGREHRTRGMRLAFEQRKRERMNRAPKVSAPTESPIMRAPEAIVKGLILNSYSVETAGGPL